MKAVELNITICYVSEIDDCEYVNCTGRGNCTDGENTYTCVCETGYSGTDCEIGKYCSYNNKTLQTASYLHVIRTLV